MPTELHPDALIMQMSVDNWKELEERHRITKYKYQRAKKKIVELTVELEELKSQTVYQNMEIQRLLQRYERDRLPPGLVFNTGLDVKFQHDSWPGPTLIQGVDQVNQILGIKQ